MADATINSFSVVSGESKFDVSFSESPRVFEIKSSAQRPVVGDLVMLRFSANNELTSILILPNDLQSVGRKSLTLNEREANAD